MIGYGVLWIPFFFAIWVAAFVYWIVVIVEVAKIPDVQFRAAGSEKIVWMLIVILGGIIGSLVWRFAKRDEVMRYRGTDPATAAGLVSGRCHWDASLVGWLPVDGHPPLPAAHVVAAPNHCRCAGRRGNSAPSDPEFHRRRRASDVDVVNESREGATDEKDGAPPMRGPHPQLTPCSGG